MSKKKFKKSFYKTCPECKDELFLVTDFFEKNGVEYSEQYIECECGYRRKYKVSTKNYKEDFSKW